MGVLHGQDGEDNSIRQLEHCIGHGSCSPITKTIRQLADGAGLVCSGDTESTDLLTPELNVLLGELGRVERLQVLDR